MVSPLAGAPPARYPYPCFYVRVKPLSVEVPTVLQLQGGSPQMKVGSVLAEKLKLVKALEGGSLGGLLSGLMSGQGLGSIMQDPLAGIVQPLLAQVQQMIGGQQAGAPASADGSTAAAAPSAMYTSLTALSSAITAMAATSAGLAGVGPASPYGPLDVVLHAITQDSAGDPVPPALALSAVVAPNGSGPLLTSVVAQAQVEVDGQARSTVVDGLTAQVTAVTQGSANAIANLRALIAVLATAQAFGGLIAGGPGAVRSTGEVIPGDASIQDWLRLIIQPTAYSQLAAAAEDLSYAPPVELGEAAPTVNLGNTFYGTVTLTTDSGGTAPAGPVEVI